MNDITSKSMDGPQGRTAKPRRRVWWWLRAVSWLIGAPVLMAMIVAVLLIGREVTAPSWVVRDIEMRAAQVLGGGALRFGAVKFAIATDLHPQLVVENAVLRDRDGAVLARVPRIQGQISPRGVLQGRVLPQEVMLSGAQISLRRARDGTVALAFDQGAADIGAADGFVDLLDQIDQVFERGALEALEQVRADGLIINYTDARAQRSWVVDDGRIALDLRGDDLELRANVALLSGRSFVTTAELTYRSPRGNSAALIGVSIENAAAADIASQSPLLSWLGVLDAPISGSVRGTLNSAGELDSTSATLQIGAGELRPTAATNPIPFQSAQAYLTFDPAREQLTFDLIEVDSDWGRVVGSAQTYLREFRDGLPQVLLGQVQFSQMSVAPGGADGGVFDTAVALSGSSVDFRLRLDPFTLDIGQAVVVSSDVAVRLAGRVRAALEGWSVALDAQIDDVPAVKVLSLWPERALPRTRQWLVDNVQAGTLHGAHVAFRTGADRAPTTALTLQFRDAQVQFLRSLPPIENAHGTLSIVDRRVAVTLDGGHVTAPQGGDIDLVGSTFVIPRVGIENPPARIDLALDGQITAALSLLGLPPFNVLADSDLGADFAQGRARILAAVDLPLGADVPPEQRVWSATADLRDVRSDVLVPGQVVTAPALQVQVDPTSLNVQGRVQLGAVGGAVTFSRALGAESQGSARLDADLTISPAFLQAFNINLPSGMVTGESGARLSVDLADPAVPSFRLTSDMRGLGLNLPAVGWSKARGATGTLTVAGTLGGTPRIDELAISAPGFETSGTLDLAPGGGLERATFGNVRLGGWLDAPVVLIGRGAGRPVAVQITGGALDLRRVDFSAGATAGGPIDIALDTLQISDRIRISNFLGQFNAADGFQGTFTGDVNGSAPISGTVAPVGGRSAVQIDTQDAGSLMRATGLLRTAFGGALRLTLLPAAGAGTFDGTIVGTDVRVQDAPALASLLDAISVVGLLAQMDGQGLLFTDVAAQFRLTPNQLILTQSSAIGPGLGISMDGIFSLASQSLDFQGVVSPFYLLNGIGSFLTRPGEGLIGFNFNLRGPVDNPSVLVNPLSAFTPGMFRDIFRRPPPTVTR